jgi:hypothetical protein
MADMNKRPNTRRSELEDELTDDITEQQGLMETGKYRNKQDPYSRKQDLHNREFNIRQGHRRRHPLRVLHQHQGVVSSSESARSVWEQAIQQDDERTKLPEIYKIDAMKMMSTQVGLEAVADDNFKKKKNKMDRLSTMIGV